MFLNHLRSSTLSNFLFSVQNVRISMKLIFCYDQTQVLVVSTIIQPKTSLVFNSFKAPFRTPTNVDQVAKFRRKISQFLLWQLAIVPSLIFHNFPSNSSLEWPVLVWSANTWHLFRRALICRKKVNTRLKLCHANKSEFASTEDALFLLFCSIVLIWSQIFTINHALLKMYIAVHFTWRVFSGTPSS